MSPAALLTTVVGILREAEIPFMLTGSLAAAFYGTPRATQDIDLVIDPEALQMDRLIEALGDAGFYVSREAAREALGNAGQFNAIDPESGWKVDLIIRKTRGFSESEFTRRQPTQLFGVEVALTTLEDLIIAKLEWSELGDSELQRRDVIGLLATGAVIDHEYIEQWIGALGLQTAWRRVRGALE